MHYGQKWGFGTKVQERENILSSGVIRTRYQPENNPRTHTFAAVRHKESDGLAFYQFGCDTSKENL
jgi:hypothetical protein